MADHVLSQAILANDHPMFVMEILNAAQSFKVA